MPITMVTAHARQNGPYFYKSNGRTPSSRLYFASAQASRWCHMTSDSAIVLANSDHVATSFFMLPCQSVHHVGRPRLRLTSSDPSVQIYSCSPPNLSLGLHLLVLHLAPSTATSHPVPALHNQGKHKYTTSVNHSLQQHWSSLSLSFAQFILHYLIFFSIAREFCSTFKLRVCQT
jgi:hypothetical protein